MNRLTETVKHLLIVNVLFFIATSLYGDRMYEWFALWFPKNEYFEIWQVVTHMFMHGGFSHIAFNMFALWMFGGPVEQYLGRNRFLFLYFSAGFGAALFQVAFYYFNYLPGYGELLDSGLAADQIVQMLSTNSGIPGLSQEQLYYLKDIIPIFNSTMVGASGCIMGILAAFGVMSPNAELMLIFFPVPIKAKYFIPGSLILLNVVPLFTGTPILGPSNTAYMAHIGGAVIGFFVMWYWKKNSFNKNRWN